MKTKDLIRKFGWEILPYLSNLGVEILQESNLFFVDGNATNALDPANTSGDEIHGNSFESPFATLNYAISQCTASQGDIILVASSHTETIEDTGTASGTTTDELVADKADIHIIGLGQGTTRPTFTFEGDTAAAFVVIAANVRISNMIFAGNLEDLATLIDASAAADGMTITNCEFRDGGTAILETIHQIDIATTCHNVTIKDCDFFTFLAGSSTLSNIEIATDCNNMTITGCHFAGDVNTDGMIDGSGGTSLDLRITDCNFDNEDSATGKCIVLAAGTRGLILRNIMHAANDGVSPLTTTAAVCAQNYYTNAEAASAALLTPATDS